MNKLNSFKILLEKQFTRAIIFVTIVFSLLGLWNLYYQMEFAPRSNDECLWSVPEGTNKIVFNFVKYDGVSWKAGIRDGDILVAINDVKVKTNTGLAQFLINQVENGDSALYTIQRNGEVIDTTVEIKKLYNIQAISYILLGLIWLLVAHIVIMAKPNGVVQRKFYWISIVISLTAMLGFHNLSPPYDTIKSDSLIYKVVDFLWLFGLSFLPYAFMSFFWNFPKQIKITKYKIFRFLLIFAPLLTFMAVYWLYSSSKISFVNALLSLVPLAFLGILVGLISLFISYISNTSKDERTPIFVILISYFLGFAAIIYYYVANIFTMNAAQFNSPEIFLPIIIVVALPVSFAYAIFKYSLMDVGEVLKNTVIYTAATLAIGLVYFGLMYLIGQTISEAIGTEFQALIAVVIFIVFAIVFQSTKDKFQNTLTAKFYPEQFAFREIIMKFSREVSTIVGLDNILDSVQETFTESLKVNRFGLLIKNNSSSKYALTRLVGISTSEFYISNFDSELLNYLSSKKKIGATLSLERSEFEKVFGQEAKQFENLGIYTIVPLVLHQKIIGLALFGVKHSGAQFIGKDLDLLVAACNQIAVSIENARLYESEAEKLKYERDLENAKKIQDSLLPQCIPAFNGLELCGVMKPAMLVGGDYYDVIKVSDTKLFVVVGDVSGKGLAASFYMSKLQTMIRLFCTDNISPKEVLTKINKQIYNQIEKNWFITVAIGLFDMEKNELTYCRAGHTSLVVVNNDRVLEHQPKGIGVGLEEGTIFERTMVEERIKLNSNDIFVLYSDGLTEAMNYEKELFGEDKLKSILVTNREENVDFIEEEITKSVKEFRGAEIQNDDITLVLIKIK